MFEKIARLALCLILVIMVASCEKPADTSGEDRLSNSFRNEGPELQQHIAVIVTEIRAHEYQDAMNKLALLAATRSLTNKQKQAVEMDQIWLGTAQN